MIFSERKNKYWEDYIGTKDLGKMESEIISPNETELVKVIWDEEKGKVHLYYIKTE